MPTFVIHLTITVNVSLPDHLIHLFVRKLLAKVGHDMSQLSSRNEAIAILVEHSKRLANLFLGISVLHLSCHHCQELREVNGSIALQSQSRRHHLKTILESP